MEKGSRTWREEEVRGTCRETVEVRTGIDEGFKRLNRQSEIARGKSKMQSHRR
jgi:hypothetical protein